MATSLDRLRSAVSSRYEIERELGQTEFATGCTGGGNCTTWANGAGTQGTSGTSFTFGFVGSQPGRWHVVAKDGLGAVISTSTFVYFGYNI